eukprot:GCRY01000211.1.p1 GENE.GCRY01000211.1~~GCRY01000211.1.p1  ORF type:complete len:170 (+),score=31.58 GCRY01000211.1:171-680(+)
MTGTSKKVVEKICEQGMKELQSSHLYLSLSNYFWKSGYFGFGKWMEKQSVEERTHAVRFFRFAGVTGHVNPKILALEEPQHDWSSPIEAFKHVYQHECSVTKSILEIIKVAEEEKDARSLSFLDQFVQEQEEEECSTHNILKKMEVFGENGKNMSFMYTLDKEMEQRTE